MNPSSSTHKISLTSPSSELAILVISFSDLTRDPRVYRQLFFLKNLQNFRIYAAGFNKPQLEHIEFIELKHEYSQISRFLNAIRLKMKRFEDYYWGSFLVKDAYQKLKYVSADIILANDLHSLPLAQKLAQKHGSKLYLDAHEYEPKHFEDKWFFRFFFQAYWDYIARQYLPQVDAMTTVGNGIAKEYERNYGVSSQIITNAPFYSSLLPQPVDPTRIKMIHHGLITQSRQLENLILLMDLLNERFSLDLMLIPNQSQGLKRLQQLAEGRSRIRFRNPVSMLELPQTINEYDIGLCLFPPISFNLKMVLPNKLFEFIQGRVAVATWPSVEMKVLVEQYACGVVSQEFTLESMAENLNQLTSDQIQTFKENASIAASELCAERNFERMSQILSSLLA